MNDELIDLAQATQREHAALLREAQQRASVEARVEVRDRLDSLRQDFTDRALALTGVQAPYMWLPENPDHAVALAVRNDIADTEMRLSNLANAAALQKFIITDLGSGPRMPKLPNVNVTLGLVGAILVVVAILVWK